MADIALCLEQTLGHRAHTQNILSALEASERQADVYPVIYSESSRIPLPWAIRGSARAYSALRRRDRANGVTFFHTQTISLFAPRVADRYVVSLDATPLQIDAMGSWYRHQTHPGPVESGKRRWYRNVFNQSSALVAWSNWAVDSLVEEYDVDPQKVLVAHPGASPAFFEIARPRLARTRPVILFVGGDFERKGGPALLRAFEQVSDRADLLLVTDHPVPAQQGVRVESGIKPGSDRLLAAYAAADIFCLPTLGDCTSVAIGEALAAGLPVITTSIGSNPETLRGGELGVLVPPGDADALGEALRQLVDDGSKRESLGLRARAHAHDALNAERNALRILDLLEDVAS
jgi:glycosyltransferase involved in cell wall biosynthesis